MASEQLLLRARPPERVLALHRGHRLDGVRPADRAGGGLGETPVLHLAGIDQLLDRPVDLLDGDVGIDAVLVVEVDRVDAEPLQRALGRVLDRVGPAGRLAIRVDETELGGDDDLAAEGRERLADERFVRQRAVHLRGVEEGHAEFHGPTDDVDHLLAAVQSEIAVAPVRGPLPACISAVEPHDREPVQSGPYSGRHGDRHSRSVTCRSATSISSRITPWARCGSRSSRSSTRRRTRAMSVSRSTEPPRPEGRVTPVR
jgi:hypothetical protein